MNILKKIGLQKNKDKKETKVALLTMEGSAAGAQIFDVLSGDDYQVERFNLMEDLEKFTHAAKNKEIDIAVPIEKENQIQELIEDLEIPYIFSGHLASALAGNKHQARVIVQTEKIPVIKDKLLKKGEEFSIEKTVEELLLPIMVRSSAGNVIVQTGEELSGAIKDALEKNDEVLLERYYQGRELAVVVAGGKALPVIEVESKICPAQIPDKQRDKIQKMALKVFEAIDCKDLAQINFVWDEKENEIYFLQINAHPDLSSNGTVSQVFKEAGIEAGEFLEELINK